ncbi:MAG: fasciclin domain-containing protein, partial [Bacteroidetes bacterium]|nr:fasciclin domain-containing protein [Bacteroidota bacterium]
MEAHAQEMDAEAAPTITQIVTTDSTFSTLAAAVKAAGLAEALDGDGPFTVFAPTNDAFAALPEGTLDTLLKPENKDQLVRIL